MLEQSTVKTEHVCFPISLHVFSSLNTETFPLNESAIERSIQAGEAVNGLHNNVLSGFTTWGHEVMSRFVPTLMCGEESATHVFQKEAKRIEDVQRDQASSSLLAQIAAEEVVHERLLGLLRKSLPVPEDLQELRRRARFFFFRLASRD